MNAYFIIIGVLMAVPSAVLLIIGAFSGVFSATLFNAFALGVMALCMAYLYPHITTKDERATFIRERGMFYAYFIVLAVIFVLNVLTKFIMLNVDQVLSIVLGTLILSAFISMVVVARKI